MCVRADRISRGQKVCSIAGWQPGWPSFPPSPSSLLTAIMDCFFRHLYASCMNAQMMMTITKMRSSSSRSSACTTNTTRTKADSITPMLTPAARAAA